jgi:bifunctional DNA-binding transcriptional regulator/antitoxin component of YhaV-PrlF toxin-antitoxin module
MARRAFLAREQWVTMVSFMNMKKRMRISKGGQISIPAPIRHRWGTSTIALEDQDDRVVLEPAPDDPIASAEGALAEDFGGLDVRRLRRAAREDERAAEARRSLGDARRSRG